MSSHGRTGAVLFAKSVPTVANFYQVMLGAEVAHADGDHVVLAAGGLELVIHGIPPHIAADIVIESPPALREETPLKLFFTVGALAEARVTAATLGGGLAPPAREWAASTFRACDGWDPEGNVVQFREAVT